MMLKRLSLSFLCLVPLSCILAVLSAQNVARSSERFRPQWTRSVSSIPKGNNTYEYRLVVDEGSSLSELKDGRLVHLGNYLKQTNRIDGNAERISRTASGDGDISTQTVHTFTFRTATSIEEFSCVLIDDYWETYRSFDGKLQYRYYCLYAVSTHPEVIFDDYSVSAFYGGKGLWRSALVPGWGQFYKGNYLNAGLIFGAAAGLAGGIVATETVRNNYLHRMDRTHDIDYKRLYARRADQFMTARNICMGALGALYVYNLIDAFVGPGAARIVVKAKPVRSKVSYSFLPASAVNMPLGMAVRVTF